ncbi:protein of unknown function, Porph ging [Sphingobacterium deserti]|uniref:GLPGLI family protein n=2 Tax=Sphingobacterium deserti TaxID=1229276 RepID=A0A0B8T2N3_9SPHI|nr:protein of unknown function, Porph ging [Sphingobacterium deserti]
MKRFILLVVVNALLSSVSFGQYAHFPESGVIHFEKRVHLKNFMKRKMALSKSDNFDRSYMDQLMSKAPESYVYKSILSFNGSESRYDPVKEEQTAIMRNLEWYGFDYAGSYYQHIDKGLFKNKMNYNGGDILLEDSLLNIKWKVTNEYRDIAGYNCRRANGVLLDSIFVVAFYTDAIPLSSGPIGTNGLPGMILGLAVPEQHYNIYATKVEMGQPQITSEFAKKRDKPMRRADFQAFMRDRLRVGDWYTEAEFNYMMVNMLL